MTHSHLLLTSMQSCACACACVRGGRLFAVSSVLESLSSRQLWPADMTFVLRQAAAGNLAWHGMAHHSMAQRSTAWPQRDLTLRTVHEVAWTARNDFHLA